MRRTVFPIVLLSACAAAGESTAQTGSCSVSATSMSFGTFGLLDTAVDTTSDISVTCSSGTAYSVGLDGGTANAAPTERKMSDGGQTITYGLYKDAARSLPWGDAGIPGGVQSGTGTGGAQFLTVYGRVPAQLSVAPGAFNDVITVIVTY